MKKHKYILTLSLFMLASMFSIAVSAEETTHLGESLQQEESFFETSLENGVEADSNAETENVIEIDATIESETNPDSETYIESESELELKSSLVENSFRYTDGVLSSFEQTPFSNGMTP